MGTQVLTDGLIRLLEREFGLKFYHSVKLRTVIGVRTSGGAMILKRYEGEVMKRRLMALTDCLDEVLQAGVEVAPYLKTRQNQPFVVHRGVLWTMQPWLVGRHVSIRNRQERLRAAQALARLHWVPTTGQSRNSVLLRVPPLWEKYSHRLDLAQDATLKAMSLRDWWRPYEERARQAIRDLQKSSYFRALERDSKHGSLCHRDPAPHNFMWQGSDAAIIDFDLAGYDVRVHDLYQLLNHALYINGWEPRLLDEMIEAYDEIMPICSENQQVLTALMNYPSLVVREWYDFGKSNDRKNLLVRMQWAMLQEERRFRNR